MNVSQASAPSRNPPPLSNPPQGPLKVNPRYPLPSPLPASQYPERSRLPDGAQGNGVARTTSRRRRVSGSARNEPPPPPVAPELPKPLPVSYRNPYEDVDPNSPKNINSTSFAARIRATSSEFVPPRIRGEDLDPLVQTSIPNRRASTSRPPGALYAAVQKSYRAPVSSPTAGSSSPPYSSSTNTPRQFHGRDVKPLRLVSTSAVPHKSEDDASNSVSRSTTRRASAGIAEPRTEWTERSPLQKLEVTFNDISKEEKRARVEEAERLLREFNAGNKPGSSSQEIDMTLNNRQSRRASASMDEKSRSVRSDDARKAQEKEIINHNLGTSKHPREQSEFIDTPKVSRPRQQGSPKPEINPRLDSRRIAPVSKVPASHDPAQKAPGRPTGVSDPMMQPERAVRFQNQQPPPSFEPDPNNHLESRPGDRRRHSKSSQLEEPGSALLTSGARSPPDDRDRSNRGQSFLGNNVSKPRPPQQQLPRSTKLESPKGKASPLADRGVTKSMPVATSSINHDTPKYESDFQNRSIMEAANQNGIGTNRNGAIDMPVHHNHHLSNILHPNRQPDPVIDNRPALNTRRAHDWRQGGVARLTMADLNPRNTNTASQSAWWESGGPSGSSKIRSKRDTQSFDGGYDESYGKEVSLFQFQLHHSPQNANSMGSAQLRQYIANDVLLSGRPRFRSSLRGREGRNFSLSTAYSHSCPHLSEHDVSHLYHICKPYMSKELTRSMRSIRIRPVPPSVSFDPPLYLKCGPLLRYAGLKREKLHGTSAHSLQSTTERETWRGSVMIVTVDTNSSYNPAPVLRLYPEPVDLLPPPPPQANDESGHTLPPEYLDPIAGLPKLSRTGTTVYVKPVEDLEEEVDLSRVEDDTGLFEETRTAAVPTSYGQPTNRPKRDITSPSANTKSGRRNKNGPTRYQQTQGVILHAERGVTFWRFNLEVELGERQVRIAYRINNSASVGFWVPARGQTMNVMFHSCNGFSMSVNPDHFSGPDPMWRDVLNSHQMRPFHVMIGGGDQIYNDAVMSQTTLFQEWLRIKNPHHKHEAPFTPQMQEELEVFYLERYSMWFSQGLFGMANSQIPMINMWDDHDIIDGFGSYPDRFMRTPVFCGVGAVAFKYYMLFQHQSVVDESMADEPSWLLGASPGPYIGELSRSVFMFLGKHVAFLGLDCRTERMRTEVLSEASYDLAFDRCRREIIEGETKHLIVLLGVPIAYPRLVWLENLLTSKVMDPIKAIGRAGILGGFLNKFDGGVEILDDLDDHWTSKNHKRERNWFVQELQELAAEKSVRVTILGGDVHLAAVGQFFSNPKLKIPKDQDHRYMANIISSAIVNTPPPEMIGDILNKRNKIHHLDHETDEDMIPMFSHDVDGKPRNNKRLLPRRNWCSIREYHPGTTPPPTPPVSESPLPSDEPQRPPNRLQRTLSLTRNDVKPGNLFRRLSQRGPPPSKEYPLSTQYRPSPPLGGSSPIQSPIDEGYFTPRHGSQASPPATNGMLNNPLRQSSAPLPRPGNFHRRPTNMSGKAFTRGDEDDHADGYINLEHGLDVALNCEVSQKDPAGITVPYRLLIPTLFYKGLEDRNEAVYSKKSWISRMGSIGAGGRRKSGLAKAQGKGEWGGDYSEESGTGSDSESERGGVGRGEWRNSQRSGDVGNARDAAGFGARQGSVVQRRQDPERRASKVDDMLGMAGPTEGRERGDGRGTFGGNGRVGAVGRVGNGNGSPSATVDSRFGNTLDDAGGHHSSTTELEGDGGGKRASVGAGKGYGGIEAYRESRWRRFF